MSPARGVLTALCALLAAGCGAALQPAFDLRFDDNAAARTAAVQTRLGQADATPGEGSALLLATTHGAQPELLAFDLGQRSLRFRRAFRADSRPELLGDLVLATAGGRLHALEAGSGATRFSVPLAGCGYLGAARSGDRLFIACERAGRELQPGGELRALDARDGRELFRRSAGGALGRPLAAHGLLFVPFQRQSLAVLDASDGDELARLRIGDDVVDWVAASGASVLFGHDRVHALSPEGAADAALTGQRLIDSSALPGRPALQPSAFEPESGTRSARGRVALYAQPEWTGGGPRVARDRFYSVFYRHVFAYSGAGALVWTRTLPSDAVAARAGEAGLWVASEDGGLRLLASADGTPQQLASLGVGLAAARFTGAEAQAPALSARAPVPLRRSLTEIALDTDSRLVPARAYAIAQLGALPDPDVTRDLLDIYDQSATPPELKAKVADALRTRRTGLEHMVDALMARYDFIEQTRPAPLAVIVPALVDAREVRALPLLIERMFDPQTPLSVLPEVVTAVAALGDATAVEPLLSFVQLYRADSSFAADPEPLLAAVRGVLALGGADANARVAQALDSPQVSPLLAQGVAELLAPARSAAQPALAAALPTAAPAPAVPARLVQDDVNAVFAEHIDDLRGCIIEELGRNPELSQVRVAFVAEADGSAHAFSFVPNGQAFVDCAYPKVASYRFPRFVAGRDVFRYVVAVRAREPERALAADGSEPWWQWYAAHPRAAGATSDEAPPWWQSRQPIAPSVMPTPAAAPPAVAAPATAPPAVAAPAPTAAAQPASPAPAPPAANAAKPAPSEPQPGATPPNAAPAAEAEDAWWVPQQPK